jgi:flagellar basal body-associated protein FliL
MEKTNQTAEINTSQKKRRKLSILIGVIGLLLIALTGVIAYSVITETPIREIAEGFRSEPTEETLVLEEFLVNLNSESGPTNQFLKINLTLEYRDSDNTEILLESVPMIRNEILACLRDLRRESVLEEASIEAFKDHARAAINTRLPEEIIDEIYITNMIVR